MPARQGRAADISDFLLKFQRRGACFTDKLPAPFLLPDFKTIRFPVTQNFDLANSPVRIDSNREDDEFMFPNHLIHNETTAVTGSPYLLSFRYRKTTLVFNRLFVLLR